MFTGSACDEREFPASPNSLGQPENPPPRRDVMHAPQMSPA